MSTYIALVIVLLAVWRLSWPALPLVIDSTVWVYYSLTQSKGYAIHSSTFLVTQSPNDISDKTPGLGLYARRSLGRSVGSDVKAWYQ